MKEGRKEGRKERRKKGRKEEGKEGKKEGRNIKYAYMSLSATTRLLRFAYLRVKND